MPKSKLACKLGFHKWYFVVSPSSNALWLKFGKNLVRCQNCHKSKLIKFPK